jgi:hypothetical protein
MQPRFDGAMRQLFEKIGPRFPTPQRAMFANLWLTRPLVTRGLESRPTTNAIVRTTAAPTIFQAGTKDNVLPTHARAGDNFRILPGDTMAGLLEYVRQVVDDQRIDVNVGGGFRQNHPWCPALIRQFPNTGKNGSEDNTGRHRGAVSGRGLHRREVLQRSDKEHLPFPADSPDKRGSQANPPDRRASRSSIRFRYASTLQTKSAGTSVVELYSPMIAGPRTMWPYPSDSRS